jgi:mono/diheme cytochrome c family protein
MKLFKLAAIVCACAFCLAACSTATNTNTTVMTNAPPATGASTPAPAATPDELAQSRQLYGQVCVRCHGAKGEGGEFDFDGKKLKAPSLSTGHVVKDSDAELAEQIAEGGEGMPAFKKRLSAEQINNLVRFIRREFQAGATTGAGNDNHSH